MKYAILTILRTPVKTITFLLLITAMTVFLSLGCGMWQSAEIMLDEADATFTTAGEFIYTGSGYPKALDFDALDGKEVLILEENITQRAYLQGYVPSSKDNHFNDYALLIVGASSYFSGGANVYHKIFTSTDMTYMQIYINHPNFSMDSNKRYAIFAKLSPVLGTRFFNSEIVPFSHFFEKDPGYPSIIDISDYSSIEDFLSSEIGMFYQEAGQMLETLNLSIDVTATSDASIVEGFHNGNYLLESGELLDGTDPNSAMIPRRIARQLGLAIGDKISLSFHPPTGQISRYMSYNMYTGYAAESIEYTVSGIYHSDAGVLPVIIPNAGQNWLKRSVDDIVLGRVSVENRLADTYLERIKAILPQNVKFELYDQGYKSAAVSINSLLETAKMLTVLFFILCALVMWFFGFLFVQRAEGSARILLALGAGKKRVIVFFLTGCGSIAVTAATSGALIGYFISQRIFAEIYNYFSTNLVYDFRYSSIGYSIKNESFYVQPAVDILPYLFSSAVIILFAIAFSSGFAVNVMKQLDPKHRFKVRKKVETRVQITTPKSAVGSMIASLLPSVSLRYSVISLLRNGKRSFIVPLLFASLLLFLCIFSDAKNGYSERLNTVYDDIPVTMRFTDNIGKRIDNLVITEKHIDDVINTGFVAEVWSTFSYQFMVVGVSKYADGTLPESLPAPFDPPPYSPMSPFAVETFVEQWSEMSEQFIATNVEDSKQFTQLPEFAYTSKPEITWAEGYNESYFFNTHNDFERIIVSDKFLETYGASVGDTINLVSIDKAAFLTAPDTNYKQWDMVICGSFPGTNPVAYMAKTPSTYSLDSAGFLLQNTDNLTELKDRLQGLVDPLGSIKKRVWAVIDDAALYSTVDMLTRYIIYMDLLYPVILGLVVGIGFLVSHLLLKSRTGEIAILRGMGTPKPGVFFSFFNEQLLLSVLGIVIGIVISYFVISTVNYQNIILLCLCYYAGLSIAIMNTYRKAAITKEV